MSGSCQPINMDEYCQRLKESNLKHQLEIIEQQTKVYNRLCRLFNVSEDYTDAELAKSYRKLLVKYHPDNPGGSLNRFDKVKDFYKKLKHARKYITER